MIKDAHCFCLEHFSKAAFTAACKSLLHLSCHKTRKKERASFGERKNSFSQFNISIQILL